MSTKSTSTPKPPNVREQLGPRRAVRPRPARRSGRPPGRSEASAAWMAAIPEASATPASPPASSAYARRRGRSWSGWRCGCRRTRRAGRRATRAELVGVGRGERRGLVDRDAGRGLARPRGARRRADGARREAARRLGRAAARSVSLTDADATPDVARGRPWCAPGASGRRSRGPCRPASRRTSRRRR